MIIACRCKKKKKKSCNSSKEWSMKMLNVTKTFHTIFENERVERLQNWSWERAGCKYKLTMRKMMVMFRKIFDCVLMKRQRTKQKLSKKLVYIWNEYAYSRITIHFCRCKVLARIFSLGGYPNGKLIFWRVSTPSCYCYRILYNFALKTIINALNVDILLQYVN